MAIPLERRVVWLLGAIGGLTVSGCFLDATSEATSQGGSDPTTTSTGGGTASTGGFEGTGGSTASTGGGGTVVSEGGTGPGGAGGAATGGGGAGGEGGSPASCGDGVVDVGEQCDDHNASPGDGCEECQIVCPDAGAVLDTATNHCYWLSTQTVSWNTASTSCPAGSHLATITSQNENDFIQGSFVIPTIGAWIGGSDTQTEGTYVWVTGEPFGFTFWEPNEPSNSGGGPGEDCIELTAGAPADWNDDGCAKHQVFLCERELVF